MMPSAARDDSSCKKSMIAPSWFDWKKASSQYNSAARCCSSLLISAIVNVPYFVGSLLPNILRFGPCITKMCIRFVSAPANVVGLLSYQLFDHARHEERFP